MSKNPNTTNPSDRAREERRRRLYYRKFGQRLRIARLAYGWSEADAAEKCNVTLRTYRGWEAGRQPRREQYFDAFSDCAGWLLGGEASQSISAADSRVAIVEMRTSPRQRKGDIAMEIIDLLPPDTRTALDILRHVEWLVKMGPHFFTKRQSGAAVVPIRR